MPATVTRRKAGRVRRREIVDAALRVIAGQGLRRFTAVAIADEIGITDGALFRHFASKEDIVLAAIDRVEQILFEGFPPAGRDPLERLGAFFLKRVATIAANPGVGRLVLSDDLAYAAPPPGVKRVASFRMRSVGFIRGCLEEAALAGILAPGIEPRQALVVVQGSLMALAHAPHLAAPQGGVEELSAEVWRWIEARLRRVPGEERKGAAPARRRRREGRRVRASADWPLTGRKGQPQRPRPPA